MRLQHPKAGKIQQGALFNCVVVPGYENCDCHGIVLTARCDLEHEKQTVINYLPVVPFSDWVPREMSYLLARRLRKSLDSSISTALTKRGVSKLIHETFPIQDIIERETTGKEKDVLLLKCAHLKLAEKVVSLGGAFSDDSKALIRIDEKQCDSLVRELLQHKLGGYYFLDAADVLSPSNDGHVVLLRKVQTLSCDLMNHILNGLSDEAAKADPNIISTLTFYRDPICMITGVLRSPDIEHLAQNFSNLFIRIGLDDYDEAAIDHHSRISKGR
jgi:hypothetical protein